MARAPALLLFGLLTAGLPASAAEIPFDFPPDLSVGAAANAARLGDLDGDGYPDAVYSRAATGTFIQLNKTFDTGPDFGTPTNIGAAAGYHGVDLGDVDGDGRIDVLVATGSGDQVLWYRNLGSGSFDSARTISASLDQAETLASADVDGDGDLDVVAASSTLGDVYWYRNDGTPLDGGWTSHAIDTTGLTTPFDLAVGDVNRDGRLDVVVADKGADSVYWYENDGTPETGTWTRLTVSSAANGVHSVRTGDIDGDGHLDVIFGDLDGTDVRWSENDGTPGDGGWTDYVIRDTAFNSTFTTSVFPVDLDRDGDLDVVVGTDRNDAGTRLYWYENDGSPTGVPWTFYEVAQYGGGAGGFSAVAGDIDGDGDLDLLYSVVDNGAVAWLLNRTVHRSARFPTTSAISAVVDGAYSVVAADLDRDGDDDVLTAANFGNEIAWFGNSNGQGSFAAKQAIGTVASAHAVFAADLDSDGDLDVLASSEGATPLVWFPNDGAGSFGPAQSLGATGAAHGIFGADLDLDGDMDVLSAHPFVQAFRWFENDPGDTGAKGTFGAGQTIGSAPNATWIRAADLDRDGDPDILAVSFSDNTVRWFENDPSDTGAKGSFGTAQTISTATLDPRSAVAADLDGDGDLDVAVASRNDASISWFENTDSAGSFGAKQVVSSQALGAMEVFAGDLDADGDVDLASASSDDNKIAWYENLDGSGSFGQQQVLPSAGGFAWSVFGADLDGDGDRDLLSARRSDDVHWYPNRGGQFALPTTSVAYQGLVDGRQRPVLYTGFVHRGRVWDSEIEPATIELRLTDGAGTPLSGAQANALFSQIQVHFNSPIAMFNLTPPFNLSSGVLTLTLPNADPDLQLAAGSSDPFFVQMTLAASASTASPNQFQIVHLTQSSSSAEDASFDLPLSLEYEEDTSSGVIQALPPTGDADSDGLANAAEADTHQSDPLDPDTDDDGLTDGAEVNTHGSQPLTKDSDSDGLLDGEEVALGTSPIQPDSDGDSVCDGPVQAPLICTLPGTDNCPLVSNAGQTNGDALPSGDLCQCGDLSGDGPVTATDYDRARELVVGRTPGGPADPDRCDVTGDSACTVEDLAVLERFLASAPVTVQTRCDDWFGP